MRWIKKKIKILLPALLLAAAIAFLAYVLSCRDEIIIYRGIRDYNTLRNTAASLCLVAACGLVASILITAWNAKRFPDDDEDDRAYGLLEPENKNRFTEPDRKALYSELKGFAGGKWRSMGRIQELLRQLDSVDEYQEELGRLLEQTQYLKTKPAEIVQQAEDCMYVNIKKLLNYMRILQAKSPEVIQEKLSECIEKNADLLKKTDDFVVAVVGYVNRDMSEGIEDQTKDTIDSYMFVVLQAIKLPETYLK